LAKSSFRDVLKRIPVIVASFVIGLGLIVLGLYWVYDLFRTDNLSYGYTSLPTIIVILGAVVIYLPFEGFINRRRGKKTNPPTPPPPP
jgi:uncharacterized membrane protein YcjF (UPF0283 family)